MSTARHESDTEKLKQRNRELSILNTIAETLNRQVDLIQALQATLSQVAELLNLHTGWVWLLRVDAEDEGESHSEGKNESEGESYLAAAQNLPPGLANFPRRMEGTCYCLDTFRAGDLAGAANVNVITCSRLKNLVDGTDGLRYHASIPLYAHGRKLGVMNVASADWRELSSDDLRLLYTIGDLLSIAIERARLFERSTELGAVEERNRLAREIHDTLAQGLAAITLQLETADALLEGGSNADRSRQAVQQALNLARANLEEARRSVLDLRAAPLEGHDLCEALIALLKEYESKWKLHTHFDAVGVHRPLPTRIEVALYRMAQEALTNVVRHARATSVTMQLTSTPGQIEMTIEDDGIGFNVSRTPQDRYGLIGLNERAKLLGGTFEVKSCPGSGARLEVRLPLMTRDP